jgi:hypothetical protein
MDPVSAAWWTALAAMLTACLVRGARAWRDPDLIAQWAGDDAPTTRRAALRYVWTNSSLAGRAWIAIVLPWATAAIGIALLLDHDRWDAGDDEDEPNGDIDPDRIQWNPPAAKH